MKVLSKSNLHSVRVNSAGIHIYMDIYSDCIHTR